MPSSKPWLVISDLQMPFEAERALPFTAYVKRHYGIPDDQVLNVGDESDQVNGGMYPKDPDATFTPNSEIKIVREKFREWGSVFPQMKLCISNHGVRWLKKATAAEIPSQLLRAYEEIYETPPGWKWQPEWRFPHLKYPFRMIHGLGYSGINGHRNAAVDSGMSTVMGHLHSSAGIAYVRTGGVDLNPCLKIWGFNVGCLIDLQAYAFKYGKDSRNKPCRGLGVIFDEGNTPFWLPYEAA